MGFRQLTIRPCVYWALHLLYSEAKICSPLLLEQIANRDFILIDPEGPTPYSTFVLLCPCFVPLGIPHASLYQASRNPHAVRQGSLHMLVLPPAAELDNLQDPAHIIIANVASPLKCDLEYSKCFTYNILFFFFLHTTKSETGFFYSLTSLVSCLFS